jgi:hypothetical protein
MRLFQRTDAEFAAAVQWSSGRGSPFDRWPPCHNPPLNVAFLARMVLQAASGDVKGPSQHQPKILLRAVARHGNFLTPHFDINAHSEVIVALPVAMWDVGNHMAGNDPGTLRIQFVSALPDLSFNDSIGLQPGKCDGHRLPHA